MLARGTGEGLLARLSFMGFSLKESAVGPNAATERRGRSNASALATDVARRAPVILFDFVIRLRRLQASDILC